MELSFKFWYQNYFVIEQTPFFSVKNKCHQNFTIEILVALF